jgi:YD repeat-containing protein
MGRTRSTTDALGNRTVYELDTLDRMTAANDPANQTIASGFDASGNLTSVTDPKGNVYQFAFDPRHAPITSTNPLNQAEGYAYVGKHNLIQKTDRRGRSRTMPTTRFRRTIQGRTAPA